jgi:hypothetical protein
MSGTNGIRRRLPPGRKLVIEMLHHARKIPSVPVARHMNLARVAAARSQVADAPSWTALFLHAYGLVAQRFPELRRAYICYPWPHLYEHPFSVGAVIVEREWQGEAALLAAKIRSPESATLSSMQSHLRRFKETPLWEVSDFRQLLRLAKLPGLLRRFIFWQTLTWSGAKKAKRFGTFLVSSYGSLGAEQVHPLSVLTTLLTFGPISASGDVVVKIIYDHRVTDGRVIARALQELEHVLHQEIVAELTGMTRTAA